MSINITKHSTRKIKRHQERERNEDETKLRDAQKERYTVYINYRSYLNISIKFCDEL